MNDDTKITTETGPEQPSPQPGLESAQPTPASLLSESGAPEQSETATPAQASAPAETPATPPPLAAVLTPEEIERLRAQAAKANEHWDKYLRAAAELENYKKRAARERQDAARAAQESVLIKLLPVLDNFEMALAAAQNSHPGAWDALKTGVTLISQQLRQALTETGLEEINAAGQDFDPRWHEAVAHQACDGVPAGRVAQQLRKGYKFRDRLLRPASVIVAKEADANSP